MMTRISDLDKRITIQAPTLASDGMGGFTETWVTIATVWAKKTTHRSNEAVQAMKETGEMVHNFRVRYRTDVSGDCRILEGSVYMAIIGKPIEVDEGPGRRWLDITVKESK